MSKYLNIGSINFMKGKDGKMTDKNGNEMYELQIDNVALGELLELIKAHGKKYLGDMSKEDIDKGQKLKWNDPNRIPKLSFICTKPISEKVADFIHLNISKKLD